MVNLIELESFKTKGTQQKNKILRKSISWKQEKGVVMKPWSKRFNMKKEMAHEKKKYKSLRWLKTQDFFISTR